MYNLAIVVLAVMLDVALLRGQSVTVDIPAVQQWEPAWFHVTAVNRGNEAVNLEVCGIETQFRENGQWLTLADLPTGNPRREAIGPAPGYATRMVLSVTVGGTASCWMELPSAAVLGFPGAYRARATVRLVIPGTGPMPMQRSIGPQPWHEFEVVANAGNDQVLGPALRAKNEVWKAYSAAIGSDLMLDQMIVPPTEHRRLWKDMMARGGAQSVLETLHPLALSGNLRAKLSMLEACDKRDDARIAAGEERARLSAEAVGILQGVLATAGLDEVSRSHASLLLWSCLRNSDQTAQVRTLAQSLSASTTVRELLAGKPKVMDTLLRDR